MSKTKRPLYFTVSVILAILMAFLLPVQVFAETAPDLLSGVDSEPTIDEFETANIVGEIKDLRDKYSKQFRLDDGSFLAVSYETPIHYKDENGNWVNYNNSLIDGADVNATPDELNSYEYTNKSSDFDVKYSKKSMDNNMVKVKTDEYMISWGYKNTNQVKANVVKNDEKLEGNEKFTALKNLTSEVLYENVYNNVDLQYITTTVGVKENIILRNNDAPNEFSIQYKFNKLAANQVDDHTVELKDKSGNVVYSIEAPYIIDAEGKSSTQLSLSITEQKNSKLTLKITADKSFLNCCAYPVTIDPTFNTTQKWQQSQCTYADSANKNTAYGYGSSTGYTGTVYAGTFGNGMYRSYIKMKSLPTLSNGDMIVDAKMNLHLYQNGFYKDMYVNAYYVSDSWNQSTLTWNNKPTFESEVVDYEKFVKNDSNAWHDWDVTTCVKRWYNGETNNGIMLKVPDESNEDQCASFYSANYPSSSVPRPLFTITYRNNKGLEDYWTYSSFSVGTAGTAYINDYSGNLVFVTSDASTSSGYGPAAVQHIYNGYMAGEKYNKSKPYVGRGWRLNIQQTLFETTGNIKENYPYVYTDEDGTDHYFYKKGSKYLDEDGLGLELTIHTSDNAYYKISDDKNNRWVFKKSGLLAYTKDSNNNKVTVNYNSTDTTMIENVTDANGKIITLSTTAGSDSGYLRYITDPADRTTEYIYDSGLLTTIKKPNGKTISFTYDDDKCLESVIDVDGYKVTFTYTSANSGKKIKSIQERGKSGTVGQKISFDRTKYNTTVINSYGADGVSGTADDLTTTYQFDQYGRTKSVKSKATNRDLGASVYKYTAGVKDSTASNIKQLNRVSNEYSTGSNPVNLIKNPNLESTANWTSAQWCGTNTFTATAVTSQKYFGQKSLKINVTSYTDDSRGRVYQDVSNSVLVPGNTYTLSGYIKTTGITNGPTNAGAVLCAESFNSDSTSNTFYSDFVYGNTDNNIDNGWQRVSVTFTVPSNSTKTRINLALRKSTGNAYFDGIQLEKYGVANNVNLLENAGLENYSSNGLPTSWSDEHSTLNTATDKVSTANYQGSSSFRIKGDSSQEKGIKQTVAVSGTENDTYIVSGWARANAVPKDDDERKFKISIKVTYSDNTSIWKSPAEFNYSVSDWQYTSAAFNLSDDVKSTDKTPSSITICLRYNNQSNYAYFDNICLIKDNAQSYTYDDDGNLVSVVSNSEEKSKMEYTNSDLTKNLDAKGYAYEYDYDDNHNMITATSQRGVQYNYNYNTNGLASSLVVEGKNSTSLKMKTNITYNNQGQVYILQDQDGNNTIFNYNDNTGTVSSVRDDSGVTSYTYDSNTDVLKSMSKQNSTVNYSYTGDSKYLTKISHNSTDYNITYDQYGNKTNSKVGTQSLASYSYDSNNGALIGTTYGTGQTVNYTYDQYGNESTRKYNGTTAFVWKADRSGNVIRETDSINNRQYDYTYDTTGRLVVKSAKDTTKANNQNGNLYKLGCGFDLNNNITDLVFNTPQRSVVSKYQYGKDNLLTKFDINSNRSVTYSYDALNRLTKASISTATPVDMKYYYADSKRSGYTTTKIEKEVIGDTTYKYAYDTVGNITQVSEILSDNTEKVIYKYTYNELNELTKVVDYNNYITSEFSYDNYGNLLKADETHYNTAGIPIKSNNKRYTYGDTNWKDKLTAYNGQTITYDAIGNPLSYRDGITMTWKNGRQLSTLHNGENSINYNYDSNSIRTSKTVNGTKYTYVYENGLLMYETRGNAKYYYSYDANGTLYSVKYTLTDTSDLLTYYYSHNYRGDIVGIYNGNGELRAKYEYDAWGNVLSIKDASGNAITSASHIGNLNPFRYRGYYYDSESGLYYLMSRYYDPVTHRFVNADTITDGGAGLLGNNLFIYAANNPVNNSDATGQWIIKDAIKWFTKSVVKPVVKMVKKAFSKVNATYSRGINFSASPSAFSFNLQCGMSFDTKGNVALQGSISGGVTGGSPGMSFTSYSTVTNATNIKKLNDFGCQVGGSMGVPVCGVPISVGGDFNIIPDKKLNKNYYGITSNGGFGSPGCEFHVELGTTATWNETQFNVFNVAKGIYIKIMEW